MWVFDVQNFLKKIINPNQNGGIFLQKIKPSDERVNRCSAYNKQFGYTVYVLFSFYSGLNFRNFVCDVDFFIYKTDLFTLFYYPM